MRLKEQAVALAVQQFADQLAEAHADVDALPGRAEGVRQQIRPARRNRARAGGDRLTRRGQSRRARRARDRDAAQTISRCPGADLTEAMATLDNAIRQIDRESRQLLQQTFDTVNENFARLFPVLFGGRRSKARAHRLGDSRCGRPGDRAAAGKRNTSIHLLSGGEKALTAISLVFALFQLNPAPFCLLDEVDAPLDDPNTDRFCRMVQDMARDTQFLFISHNKITMEMANQLVGITMPEPGISRVVAVDIAEALELASTGAA
jgi:chromosome segregation protein